MWAYPLCIADDVGFYHHTKLYIPVDRLQDLPNSTISTVQAPKPPIRPKFDLFDLFDHV